MASNRKGKQPRKTGKLPRRFKKLADRLKEHEQTFIAAPRGVEKMSTVIERFLEPYFPFAETYDAYNRVMTIT